MKIYFSALILTLMMAASAHAQEGESRSSSYDRDGSRGAAGLFVEPGLTGEFSNSRINYPISNSSGSVNGYGVSARLGIHLMDVVFLGVDGRYSRPQFNDSTFNTTISADQWNVGPVLGVQTPFLGIRVWGAYIPWAELRPNDSNGVTASFTNGTGYRFGLGLRFSVISVNAEYQRLSYGQTTIQSTVASAQTDAVELKNDSYILGLSFPIAL